MRPEVFATSAHRRPRTAILLGAFAAIVLALGAALLPSPASAAGTDFYASPSGTGTACTTDAPCSLQSAVNGAPAGGNVWLTGGSYPTLTLTGGHGTAASPITVQPAPGSSPVLTRLTSKVGYVTWSGITDSTTFYISATNQTITDSHFAGGGLFVRSTNATVTDSLFEGGASIDGIQVGGASNVLIQGNTVRNYNQNNNNGLHADCIQVFDSANITIRGNSLSNCYNAGIITSIGSGEGINTLLIESNFIQGCIVESSTCGGGSAVDLSEPTGSNLTVRSNTILNGSARISPLPGSTYDRNIIQYIGTCDAPLTNSIVATWNVGSCGTIPALGGLGNKVGTVSFVNQATGDLHLANPIEAQIAPYGSMATAATDYDGDALNPNLAGADSVAGIGPGTPPSGGTGDLIPPTVSISSPLAGSTVTGVVSLVASASDNVGVTSVSFAAAGATLGNGVKQADGTWVLSANTAGYPKGSYTITAQAKDAAGNVGASAGVKITVGTKNSPPPSSGGSTPPPAGGDNPPDGGGSTPPDGGGTADVTPPTVSITSPTASSTVSGAVSIVASASDNVGVASVTFSAAGKALGSGVEQPDGTWTLSASTAGYPKGSYTLTATAKDAAGNSTTSAGVKITVK